MEMAAFNNDLVRFMIGDVRDRERHIVHWTVLIMLSRTATKIVPTAEYDPFECVKTNVLGAMNLIDACIDKCVKRIVALSTDKTSSPLIYMAQLSLLLTSCLFQEILTQVAIIQVFQF